MKNQKVANSFEDVQARFKAMEEQEQAKQRIRGKCDQNGLGERLKEIKNNLKMSDKAMASRLGCDERTLRNYESSKTKPSYKILSRYAEIGNVSLEYIFGRSENSILDEKLLYLIKKLPEDKKELYLNLLK